MIIEGFVIKSGLEFSYEYNSKDLSLDLNWQAAGTETEFESFSVEFTDDLFDKAWNDALRREKEFVDDYSEFKLDQQLEGYGDE